jgi:hypothetical protein
MAGLVFKLLQALFQRLSASRRHEIRVVVHAPAERRDVKRISETKENERGEQGEKSQSLRIEMSESAMPSPSTITNHGHGFLKLNFGWFGRAFVRAERFSDLQS